MIPSPAATSKTKTSRERTIAQCAADIWHLRPAAAAEAAAETAASAPAESDAR